jgi:hypothetical protein
MSKAWKWLIGIGLVLLVGAAIVASLAPFVLARFAPAAALPFLRPFVRIAPRAPFGPGFFAAGRRFPFFGFYGLANCVWPLLMVGLVVLLLASFSRRPAPPTYMPMPPAPPAGPVAPAALPVCANCGQPLQPGWRHCPNCGTPIAG